MKKKFKILLMSLEVLSLNIKVINDTIGLLRNKIDRLDEEAKELRFVIGYLLKKNKLETFVVSRKEYDRNRSFFKGTEFITNLGGDEVLLAKKIK